MSGSRFRRHTSDELSDPFMGLTTPASGRIFSARNELRESEAVKVHRDEETDRC